MSGCSESLKSLMSTVSGCVGCTSYPFGNATNDVVKSAFGGGGGGD